jgi:hypothetical protein
MLIPQISTALNRVIISTEYRASYGESLVLNWVDKRDKPLNRVYDWLSPESGTELKLL